MLKKILLLNFLFSFTVSFSFSQMETDTVYIKAIKKQQKIARIILE